MLIASAKYKDHASGQTALIRILQRATDFCIAVNIGGEDEGWVPARLQTTRTEAAARTVGNVYHAELKCQYGMQRIA